MQEPEQLTFNLPKRPGFHFARIENSDRLKRVFDYLTDCLPHTTRDIIENAHVCAVNSCVDEIRANGFKIECKREGRNWVYQMEKPQ